MVLRNLVTYHLLKLKMLPPWFNLLSRGEAYRDELLLTTIMTA